jgi:hypothetical protein
VGPEADFPRLMAPSITITGIMSSLRKKRKREILLDVSKALVPRSRALPVAQLQTTPFSIPSPRQPLQDTIRLFPLITIQLSLQILRQYGIHSLARQIIVQLRIHNVLDDVLKLRSTAIQHTALMLAIVGQRMQTPHRQGIWNRQQPILPLRCRAMMDADGGRKPLPLVIAMPSNTVTV